jgi:omega-6 fatty acid desaturase (delta-12 desaturase)
MRTHKELLIATRAFARENRARSWWHFGSTLGLALAVIAVVCSEAPLALRLPASIALGFVIVRLFVMYHDHQHGAILSGSRLADCLMRTIGLLMLSPSSGWKRSHDHHHTHNSKLSGPNVGSFPLMTLDEYRNASFRERLFYCVERHPLTMICGYLTVFLVGMCVLPLLANARRHLDGALAILCHGAVLIWLGTDEIDDLWLAALIPCSIASAIGAYLFYAQHNFPAACVHPGQQWNHTAAALESSSYIPMGPVMGWFTANIGYHHVHHLNSRIPFYRLPEAMAALPELQSPRTTTLHPRDIAACLRLRLCDPASGRLVSWSALDRPVEIRSRGSANCEAA